MTDSAYQQQPFSLANASSAYVPSFDVTLLAELDSTLYFPRHVVADTLPARHILTSVEAGLPKERQPSSSPLFWGLLFVYLLVVAVYRFRLVPVSGTSLRSLWDRQLPHLFLTDRSAAENWTRRMQFVALVWGFAFCLVSLMRVSGDSAWTAFALAGCLLYFVSKMLLRFLSALLLDVETLSVAFARKKHTVYYNVLLCLVPLAFVYYLYPFMLFALLFPIIMAVAIIYLFFNAINIFSIKMKSYGIFLYFCTLEIMPAACVVVYMIRSC